MGERTSPLTRQHSRSRMRTVTKILAAFGLVSALGYWKHQGARRTGVTPRQHVKACLDQVGALTDNPALFIGAGEKPRKAG